MAKKLKFLGTHDTVDPANLAIWAAKMHNRNDEVRFDYLCDEQVVVAYTGDTDPTEDEMRDWVSE